LAEFGKTKCCKIQFYRKGDSRIFCADGSKGYEKEAPYDKILCSATVQKEIPKAWKDQLKEGGKIVTPVRQSIWLLIKKSDNVFEEIEYPGFVFVPLIEMGN